MNCRNNKTAILISAVFLIAVDRFLKAMALGRPDQSWELVPGLLKFRLAMNPHIAFSLPVGGDWLAWFLVPAILALVLWLVRLFSAGRLAEAAALWAVILGAAGNLLDRFRYGAVVDYLDLRWFTVFNLADALIVAGAAGLLWLEWRKKM